MSNESIREKVQAELDQVLDPCSCHTDQPISIVDLGLVENIEICSDESVNIELVVTSLSCTYFAKMASEIEKRLLQINAISEVSVKKETHTVWTPARMDNKAQERRRQKFSEKMERHNISPVSNQ